MPYFLAIDAGGTKTDYLLADEHHPLARVRGRTIKRLRAGASETAANLIAAVHRVPNHRDPRRSRRPHHRRPLARLLRPLKT